MLVDAVLAVGNYGESHDNRINTSSREPINYVNNGTTGLIHSLPFGRLTREGPSLRPRLEEIFGRGSLRCAIEVRTAGRPGFAGKVGNTSDPSSYSGMDVDYCLAIAASIFATLDNTLEFIEVRSSSEGFDLLHKGEVDVLAGAIWDFEWDVKDPQTGVGFSFSAPYFYNSSSEEALRDGADANLCLATREDYIGWSDYVFWIVQATFYAEEENIFKLTANKMPTTNLYGKEFTDIFQNAIGAVGNYGEIYERNVQAHIPRQGMNLLYDKSNPTPLFYIPPGVVV